MNKTVKFRICRSEMKQVIMRRRTLMLVLAIYFNVTTTYCSFNPLMDSEYFSIDWAGHESSKPDNVSTVASALGIVGLVFFCSVQLNSRRLN